MWSGVGKETNCNAGFLMEWPLCFPVIDVLDVIPVIDVKNVMDGVFPRKGSDASAANAKDP